MTYTLVITSGSPTGDTVYTAIDKLEDNIDQVITDLNNCHMTANGALIYRAAGATTQLAIGSANQMLTSSGTAPQWSNAYALPLYTYMPQRGIFTYNGGTSAATIKVKSARHWCKDKWCQWDSELTTTQAASGSPTAKTWYYLYLDYSAITSGTAITNAELIWSTTAPSWSATYRGWYNSDDLCVFACLGNAAGNNFVEFFHDGGEYVLYADQIAGGKAAKTDYDFTAVDVTTDWSDHVYLQIPGFSTKAGVTFYYKDVTGSSAVVSYYWRTHDQTGTTAHYIGYSYNNNTYAIGGSNSAVVITDSGGIIQVMKDNANADTLTVWADGWYFPIGM
jgi:hypothetical protein